jgi:hypothetical protein
LVICDKEGVLKKKWDSKQPGNGNTPPATLMGAVKPTSSHVLHLIMASRR